MEIPVILSPLSCTQMDSISSNHGETCFLVWVKSPFYLDRTEKHTRKDIRRIFGLLNCLRTFGFGSVLLKGDYTAANRDALSLLLPPPAGGSR